MELIRCRDCDNYRKAKGAEAGYCKYAFLELDISDDDFCSRAEPRKADTELYVEATVDTPAAGKVRIIDKTNLNPEKCADPENLADSWTVEYYDGDGLPIGSRRRVDTRPDRCMISYDFSDRLHRPAITRILHRLGIAQAL